MAVGAALLLLLGLGLGFALGRATAPKAVTSAVVPTTTSSVTTMPAGVVEEVPTETADATFTDEEVVAEEPAEDTTPPPKPKQLAPANGAVLNTSRVNLRWSKVKDDSGNKVTYSFEIQSRRSNGTYGSTQTIKGLSATSYSARVLSVRRRWRVWAVDEAGNAGSKSSWRTYIHKYVAPPKKTETATPSDETT